VPNLISVDWRGRLFDCDFNQMLEISVSPELPRTIFDFESGTFAHRSIMTARIVSAAPPAPVRAAAAQSLKFYSSKSSDNFPFLLQLGTVVTLHGDFFPVGLSRRRRQFRVFVSASSG
jgi:hypothetical protein